MDPRHLIFYLVVIGLDVFSVLTANCPPDGFLDRAKCPCSLGDVECTNISSWTPFPREVILNKLIIKLSPNLKIKNNSFNNLRLESLELSQNDFTDSSFETNSFDGITVNDLLLDRNDLTIIPTSVGKIKNLKGLNISLNSMSNFSKSEATMKILGSTLFRFSFGSQLFQEWPKQLRYFPVLKELSVIAGNFTLMPSDPFYGFEKNLRKLLIQKTNLESVPLAIAQLDYLKELRFDHNELVGDYGMNFPVVPGFLTHLDLMSLKDDDITTFPKIIGTFQNLKEVLLDENNLEFVSDESATTVQRVTTLSLRNSKMTRIPGALQRITSLTSLDISDNAIHSVDSMDLQGMKKLEEIKLNNNPILFISSTAFKNLQNLNRVELRNTNLTQIPCSLRYLELDRHNVTVDLSNNKIECTCELSWFTRWKVQYAHHHITVLGNCETINSSLEDYFETLDSCPQSNLCV